MRDHNRSHNPNHTCNHHPRYDVFLERHWKKMVIDMRKGELNRHLPIPDALRDEVESKMLPNVERSHLLDKALKRLGFHARAGGHFGGKPSNRVKQSKAFNRSVKKSEPQDVLGLRPITPTAVDVMRPGSVVRRASSPADSLARTKLGGPLGGPSMTVRTFFNQVSAIQYLPTPCSFLLAPTYAY